MTLAMTLENGGVASGVANYCTPAPPDWSRWGYETLRVFGSAGFVESINHGAVLRLVQPGTGIRTLHPRTEQEAPVDRVLGEIRAGRKPTLELEEELHPTRMAIRAKRSGIMPACRPRVCTRASVDSPPPSQLMSDGFPDSLLAQ